MIVVILLQCRFFNWAFWEAYQHGKIEHDIIPTVMCAQSLHCPWHPESAMCTHAPWTQADNKSTDSWNTAWEACFLIFPDRPWHGTLKPDQEYWFPTHTYSEVR
jgi:hypothetical protein